MKLVYSLLLVLASCTTIDGDYDGYTWVRSSRPPLPYRWQVVDQETLQARCQPPAGRTANGCAIYLPGLCLIVAQEPEDQSPSWIVNHEKKHCAGYDHLEP